MCLRAIISKSRLDLVTWGGVGGGNLKLGKHLEWRHRDETFGENKHKS